MINKIKDAILLANVKILTWISNNAAKIIGALAALMIVTGLFLINERYQPLNRPASVKEFADTSVMIVDRKLQTGGSGVILRSREAYSEILTNKHVCVLTEGGGFVEKDGQRYMVEAIKKYPFHDLCMVKVMHNFNVNTSLAPKTPKRYGDAFISGHPALLPHALTKGNFSGHKIISIVVGLEACTKENSRGNELFCLFYGGVPIVQRFYSQLVTGTILPGSSGSGVFDAAGNISGLVFASQGGDGLNYAFIVPYEFLVNFLNTESNYKYKYVNKLKTKNLIYNIFEGQKACSRYQPEDKFKTFCKNVKDYLIWER